MMACAVDLSVGVVDVQDTGLAELEGLRGAFGNGVHQYLELLVVLLDGFHGLFADMSDGSVLVLDHARVLGLEASRRRDRTQHHQHRRELARLGREGQTRRR